MYTQDQTFLNAINGQSRRIYTRMMVGEALVPCLSIDFSDVRERLIGSFSAKSITVTYDINDYGESLLNQEISLYVTVSGSPLEVLIGKFYVDPEDITYDEINSTVSFVAYDTALEFNKQIEPITFPVTGEQLVTLASEKVGVEVKPFTPNLIPENKRSFEGWNIGTGSQTTLYKVPMSVFDSDYNTNLVSNSDLLDTTYNTEIFTRKGWASTVIEASKLTQILQPNTQYTISYTVEKIANSTAPTIYGYQAGFSLHSVSDTTQGLALHSGEVKNIGDKVSYSKSFTTKETIASDLRLLFYSNRYTTNGVEPIDFDTVKITNFKIEKGATKTKWTLSPKDLHNTSNPVTYNPSSDQYLLLEKAPLEALEVGYSRNYLRKSHDFTGGGWSNNVPTAEKEKINIDGISNTVAHFIPGFGGSGYYQNVTVFTNDIAVGEYYTISIFAKGNGRLSFGVQGDYQTIITVTNEWKQYTLNIQKTTDTALRYFIMYTVGADTELFLHSPMLIKGNVSDPRWSYNWEDLSDSQKPATRIRTKGGNVIHKYFLNVVSPAPLNSKYNVRLRVKNIGDNPLMTYFNYSGSSYFLLKDESKFITHNVDGNGSSNLMIQFRNETTATLHHDLDFIAYQPIVVEGTEVNLPLPLNDHSFDSLNVGDGQEYTYRDLIMDYASLNGVSAHINRDGKLEFRNPFSLGSDVTIDGESYTDLKLSKEPTYIDSVAYIQEGVEDPIWYNISGVADDFTNQISIKDNPLISLYDRVTQESVIKKSYDSIMADATSKGVKYHTFESNQFIGPHYDSMDKLTINDKNDISYNSIAHSVSWSWNGGMKGTLSGIFAEEAKSDQKLSGTARDIKSMGIKVNRVDGRIEAFVQEVETIEEKTNELSSLIELTSQELSVEIINREQMGDEILSQMRSAIELEVDNLNVSFSELQEKIESGEVTLAEVSAYFNFSANGLEIGKSDSPFKINIDNEEISFVQNGQKVAYITGSTLYIQQSTILNSITMANHIIEKSPFTNGRTLFRRI